MPATWTKCDLALAIRLEEPDPQTVYSPGDTLIGHVVRKLHAVSPRARVTIKLCGRAKTKIQIHQGGNDSLYRGRFQLINEEKSSQTLYDGPIHIPQGGEAVSWPFAVTIPTHVPPELAKVQDASYLPLDQANVAQQMLPSSIRTYSSKVEAFVEYWLEASLRIDGQGDMHGTYTSLLPFTLRVYHPGSPLADSGLKTLRQTATVASQRLVPGSESMELSTRDRMKKFFQTSSVPIFRFQFEIRLPTIIQLDPPIASSASHTEPIPVMMRLVPLWQATSEVLQDIPQEVVLRSLSIVLESTTEARASGSFRDHTVETSKKVNIVPPSSLSPLRSRIIVPCAVDATFLNVGEAINLRLGYKGPREAGQSQPMQIYPSMETYNIRHRYSLTWEAALEIAGETVRLQGSLPGRLDVMESIDPRGLLEPYAAPPPLEEHRSDSWIQPPSEGDAPPTFTQVQKEDMHLEDK